MPALSNGNTCWGNRKAFNFHTEYISDNFLFDLGEVSEDFSSAPTPGQNFVSSNSYYGYHRVPDPPVHEKMSVDECAQASFDGHDRSASSRKRPNTQEENDIVKRIRHQESKGNKRTPPEEVVLKIVQMPKAAFQGFYLTFFLKRTTTGAMP